MQNQDKRARAVKATIAFLENTALAADACERHLLNRFVAGELTIEQVLEVLEDYNSASPVPTSSSHT